MEHHGGGDGEVEEVHGVHLGPVEAPHRTLRHHARQARVAHVREGKVERGENGHLNEHHGGDGKGVDAVLGVELLHRLLVLGLHAVRHGVCASQFWCGSHGLGLVDRVGCATTRAPQRRSGQLSACCEGGGAAAHPAVGVARALARVLPRERGQAAKKQRPCAALCVRTAPSTPGSKPHAHLSCVHWNAPVELVPKRRLCRVQAWLGLAHGVRHLLHVHEDGQHDGSHDDDAHGDHR